MKRKVGLNEKTVVKYLKRVRRMFWYSLLLVFFCWTFQYSPMKTSFACSSRSFVSWSLVFTVTNSICWRCRMTLSSPRTTFSVGLGHNSREFPPQCAVQVARDVRDDLTARLSHRFATHAQDHGLWNVLRSSENWVRTSRSIIATLYATYVEYFNLTICGTTKEYRFF